jgi:hypothetical protein
MGPAKVCARIQVKLICTQPGAKLDHLGIRAQLLGNIELVNSGVKNHGFLSLSALHAFYAQSHCVWWMSSMLPPTR